MEIKINGSPKDIADLALELQNRRKKNIEHDDVIQKQINLLSEASENCTHMNKGNPENGKALASLTQALVSLYDSATAFTLDIDDDFLKKINQKVAERRNT